MASIRKRGDSYTITILCGKDMNGKWIRKYFTFKPDPNLTPKKQEKEAYKYAEELEEKLNKGYSLEGEKTTFKEFSEIWFDNIARPHFEKSTLAKYRNYLDNKINPHIGAVVLTKIRPHTIEKLYKSLIEEGYTRNGKRHDYQYRTLKRIQDILNSIFKYAQRLEIIERNPCDIIKTPRVGNTDEKVKFLTADQVDILLTALDKEYKFVFREHDRVDDTGKPYHVKDYTETFRLPLQFITFYYVALYGGLRRGENISLTWEDIDFEKKTISINKATAKSTGGQYLKAPKTKMSNRVIFVPDEVIRLLKKLKLEQNTYRMSIGDQWQETFDENGKPLHFVYTQANGKQMFIDTPGSRFTKLIADYNKTVEKEEDKLPNVTLHALRHTMATLLIGEGVEISTVSGRLGHADITTTLDIYTHYLQEHDKTASNTLTKFMKKRETI